MFFVNYLTFFTTTFKLHPKNIGVLENKQFSKANYPCLDHKKSSVSIDNNGLQDFFKIAMKLYSLIISFSFLKFLLIILFYLLY